MKRTLLWIVFWLATAANAAAVAPQIAYPPTLKPLRQEEQAAHLAAEVLARYHYRGVALDDAFSAKIFDAYLKHIDPEKMFFDQADITRMSADRTELCDAILKEDLRVPFSIFNLYQRRAAQRFTYARALLKKGFDFSKKESYRYARENAPWPKNEAELNDLWRKRVKNDWLRLKLAGKDDKSIVAILDARYDNMLRRIDLVKSADAFQTFMNSYTMSIDPHTNYMGPRAAEEFDISMRLSLVGIGAVLAQRGDYTTIRELVPGGPAARSGLLKSGDRIVGVAQGSSGPMKDVVGWRLDDTVALIRGAPDTIVRLELLPAGVGPDGKHKTIALVRKKITLQQQAAKASVHTVKDGGSVRRIGVIKLPSFYEDFAARQKGIKDYRSAARDVSRLLAGFRKQKVDGVLIDLRNDGGGSLSEAIRLTGLFIDKGPVVQERNASGTISVERDTHAGVAWGGPMGVLINRGSASASEIFAAAIQDYGRGLIIGSPSFGKGTVQTMVNLDEIARTGRPEFGELKMTVAQFFRINGGTTQLRGVTPDIALPSMADTRHFGESSYPNALPWTHIKAADYTPVGNLKALLPKLIELHEARVKKDLDYQFLEQDVAEHKRELSEDAISLNEVVRRRERDEEEAKIRARERRERATTNVGERDLRKIMALRDDGLQPDERNLATELAAEKEARGAKDVLLDEAVNILSDEVGMLKDGARIAGRANQPVPALTD